MEKAFRYYMKKISLVISVFFCFGFIPAQGQTLQSQQVIVTDTSSFDHVKHYMRVDKTYCSGMHTLEAIFPYIQTNHYQVIKNQEVFSGGEVRENAEAGNRYIGYSLHTPELNAISNIFYLGMSFDVATININVDFDAIKAIYPYDTNSKEYIENTGDVTTCILPHHPHIEAVADELWAQSSDIIDYARRCYEYTATHLKYLDDNTGIHSLQSIIDNGGGDCGNFSSYYISLLRNRNIPSRPVVGVIEQDNYHVWPEFYLQDYGWIPVDPTCKNGDPTGDYFGHKNSPHYITTLGIELTDYRFAKDSEPMQLVLMQLLYYLWWAYDPCTSTQFDFTIERGPSTTVDIPWLMQHHDNGTTSKDGIIVYTQGNTVIIDGGTGEMKQVFDLNGRLLALTDKDRITIHTKGIYLIKVGNRTTRKVVLVR